MTMNFTNTNLNLYRSFIAVYEVKSIRRASELLNISHASISLNVKELSNQLGVKLFKPLPRGVEPTGHADKIYPVIKEAFDTIKRGEESLKDFDSETIGTIKVAIPSTLVTFFLKGYFKEFKKKFPNIRFEFFNRAKQENFDLLVKGKMDLIIDLDHVCRRYDFMVTEIQTHKYVFVASKDFLREHNLSSNIIKETLAKLPIIGHREPLNDLSRSLEFDPYIVTATTEPVFYLAQEGIGIGYCVEEVVDSLNTNGNLVKLNVDDLKPTQFTYSIGYKKSHITQVAQEFIKGLKDHFSKRSS